MLRLTVNLNYCDYIRINKFLYINTYIKCVRIAYVLINLAWSLLLYYGFPLLQLGTCAQIVSEHTIGQLLK